MSKYCSDCQYLNTDKAKCDGVYHCRKIDDYASACNLACDKFERNWLSNYEQQKLYDLGKEAKKNEGSMSMGAAIFLLIAITILYLIAKLSGY